MTGHRNPWAAFWQILTRYQREKITPWLALRNTIGVTLPLAGGAALGSVAAGLLMSTGALNVSFSDSHGPYMQRARRMLAASALVGLAVFVGALCGQNPNLSVAAATVWAFAAGLLVALSTEAADLGALSLVTLVVFEAVPLPLDRAAHSGLAALGGALLQTVLALAFWPVRRYVPEQRALGTLYLKLAQSATSPVRPAEAPLASAETTEAQSSLAALHRDHSVERERHRLLLSQAERIRLSLLALGRLRMRLERDNPHCGEGRILERYFEIASYVLDELGRSLRAGEAARTAPEHLHQLQALSEEMRQAGADPSAPAAAMAQDARTQMDAMTGQLRSAVDLAAYASPAGLDAFLRRQSRTPWHLRLEGTLATLRANLSLRSAACRHAVRLAAAVLAGSAVAQGLGLPRPYWVPMTIAIVLKPDFTATFSRGVLRLGGTFAGLVFATALFHVLPEAVAFHIAAIAALMFMMRCFGGANYGLFVTAVSALVVFLVALTGVRPQDVVLARGENTLAGGIIALVAYGVWPTWERTRVPEAVAWMLEAYREYFRSIASSYLNPELRLTAELDRTRVAARLARSNVEASLDRLASEPGTSATTLGTLSGILASSHRLVHAIMALEAGLASSHPVPARAAFRPFANHVELTLYFLASALRGSPLEREQLPDLREDHHALVSSGDSLTERYALVNVETDRITNSLNTLTGDVARWTGSVQPAVPQPA